MSEHATHFICYLQEEDRQIDPSLLLLLTGSKQTISKNGCTAYLDKMYSMVIFEPFCKGLISLMEESATEDVKKRMLDYCRDKSTDVLKSATETLAGLAEIYAPCIEDKQEARDEIEEEIKLNMPNFEEFFPTVTQHLREMIGEVTPRKFVCALTKNQAIDDYNDNCRAAWGVHIPFMCQTYDMEPDKRGRPMIKKGSSAFFIFRTASDGVRAVASFLREGQTVIHTGAGRQKMTLNVMGVNELTLPGMLCNLVLDCEAAISFYGGRLTSDDIQASMDRFLSRLLRFWGDEGVLPMESFVSVAIKNKSRPLPGDDYRVSRHCVPYIIATPEMHQAAQELFLAGVDAATGRCHKDLIHAAKEAAKTNGDALPESHELSDLEFWDFSARNNGIAIHGSKKRATDQHARFDGIKVFYNDTQVQFEECEIPPPHGQETLSESSYHQVIWQMCYTTPKFVTEYSYPISYTDAFLLKPCKAKGNGVSFFLQRLAQICVDLQRFAPIGIRTHSPRAVGAGGWGWRYEADHPRWRSGLREA